MARKRMFDNEIINQDNFLELPKEAIALYFLLGMNADDEGFVAPKKILRLYGFGEDNLKVLIAKNFVIKFESGVIVITDWKRNNYLDKNKVTDTIYQEEKKLISYNPQTQKYQWLNQSLTEVKPELNKSLPSIEENSIEEYSIEEYSSSKENKNNINNINNININNIAVVDEKNKLQEIFINCIGSTNLNSILECISYLDDLPLEVIEVALKRTADANGNWKYAKAILNNWVKNNIDTIEKVNAKDLEFRNRGKPKDETDEEKRNRRRKALEESLKDGD